MSTISGNLASNRQTRIQSPSYPVMSLDEAISKVAKIEERYRSSTVDRLDAAKLLGYAGATGPSNMTLASLSAYGLLERTGKGEVRVTERARSILYSDNPNELSSSLKEAAFTPSLYRELRERFPDVWVPPEEGVATYLNKRGFNSTAVRPAAKAFLQTMRYLQKMGVTESSSQAGEQAQESSPPPKATAQVVFGGARIGDLVQWESNGILMLDKPHRVRRISEDGRWIAVEGSETGIPMEQVIVHEQTQGQEKFADPPRFPPSEPAGQENGPGTDLRFQLGKGIVVRINSPKELGADELDKLVALITAQSIALKG